MEKINFTNGQAPAINGANLNQLQANVEEAISNILIPSVNATGGSNVTLTNGNASYPFTTLENNTMGAVLSNGGVSVPYDGIINVSVSAMISPKKGYVGVLIKKNENFIADFYDDAGNKTYGCLETANRLIEVKQGDVIKIEFQSSDKTDTIIAGQRTRMTIFYVKKG